MKTVEPQKQFNFEEFIENRKKKYNAAIDTYKASGLYREKIVIGMVGHGADKMLEKHLKDYVRYYLFPNRDKIDYIITTASNEWENGVIRECIKLGIKYKIYLAFEDNEEHLADDIHSNAYMITSKKKSYKSKKDKQHYTSRNIDLVNSSHELHVFIKKPISHVIDTIMYCKEHKNKFIFNWADLRFYNRMKGINETLYLGYRYLYMKDLMDVFDEVKMNQNVLKGKQQL